MSSSHQRRELPAIPCVRGRNNAAELLQKKAFQDLNRQDSLLSSSSYASDSSWKSHFQHYKHPNEPHILLPSDLPYLANGGGMQGLESSRNSWQSYMESSEWEEGYEKGAFFTTLVQKHVFSNPHAKENELYESDHSSALGGCSAVSSGLSGYTDCNKDDIAIWKKLEKALDTRFNSKKQTVNHHIPLSLQPGSSFPQQFSSPKYAPGRHSEPPKAPVPTAITPRPNTLIYQYQRITAAGSAAKHRRIYNGGHHNQ